MKKCLVFIFSFFFFSCDNEIPIDENFVVEAFLFQGEVVDDIKIKEAKMWNTTDSITDYIENADVIIFGLLCLIEKYSMLETLLLLLLVV